MLFVLLFQFLLPVNGEGGCRHLKFLNCIQNKTLTGHVIRTINMATPALALCQSKCFLEKHCVSLNLGPIHRQNRSCELNAADHSIRPDFLVNKTGYEYCSIQNPCLSNPCPPGRLCTPDFSWNTYSCDNGGWTQWGPWFAEHKSSNCVIKRTRSCTSPVPRANGTSCRGEAVKCLTDCTLPLGMEDTRIPNDNITASSHFYSGTYDFRPGTARLNKRIETRRDGGAGWAARSAKTGEYIQVNFGVVKFITMVAIQGRYSTVYNQWVTKYSLSYSYNAKDWKDYEEDGVKIFPGNNDETTVVTNKLALPINAKHIRLTVEGFKAWPSLRMELYGC